MNDVQNRITAALAALKVKVMGAMDEGPFGPDITITPEEATLIYRLMFGDAAR